MLKATLNSAFKAIGNIDMRKHKGQHPLHLYVDVVQFISVRNVKGIIELAACYLKIDNLKGDRVLKDSCTEAIEKE